MAEISLVLANVEVYVAQSRLEASWLVADELDKDMEFSFENPEIRESAQPQAPNHKCSMGSGQR